ncbi:ParA family protein [Enterococcus casseliflavus]|uniref:ParA family protein n=1 Tax=Enterococcus casseliflavus TaxID=37734 RepID=UPI002DB8750E|nr:ParA family protein [Enterococcus casseliflavus]MEB6213043.1 ParA family protein [Enterococcus casseliflavus]
METASIISVINMKGGVGKTTVSINLANILSIQKKNTLVIDTDPQFNATQSLLLHKASLDNQSTSKVEKEKLSAEYYTELSRQGKTIMQVYDPTFSAEPSDNPSLVLNIKDNLDLIPGDLRLASTVAGDTSNKVAILEDHLERNGLLNHYDYIIIDCPPTWTILTHSSLYASNFYLIPSKIDLYSSLGIQLLEEQISSKITSDSQYRKTGKSLINLGVLFTMVNNKSTTHHRKHDIKETFKDALSFFDVEIPFFPSAATNYLLYEEKRGHEKYTSLINSMDKFVIDFESLINQLEDENNEG